MKPKAFLPSTTPWSSSTVVVPAPVAAKVFFGVSRVPKHRYALDAEKLVEQLDTYLREHRNAPRALRLEWMNLRHRMKLQLEARDPIPEAELRLIAERLGRKAQSGIAPTLAEPDIVGAIKKASR